MKKSVTSFSKSLKKRRGIEGGGRKEREEKSAEIFLFFVCLFLLFMIVCGFFKLEKKGKKKWVKLTKIYIYRNTTVGVQREYMTTNVPVFCHILLITNPHLYLMFTPPTPCAVCIVYGGRG